MLLTHKVDLSTDRSGGKSETFDLIKHGKYVCLELETPAGTTQVITVPYYLGYVNTTTKNIYANTYLGRVAECVISIGNASHDAGSYLYIHFADMPDELPFTQTVAVQSNVAMSSVSIEPGSTPISVQVIP